MISKTKKDAFLTSESVSSVPAMISSDAGDRDLEGLSVDRDWG
jgi:hypothetical protein|eukprot:CAMPEP_0119043766 /NCGR_PEP_ID=MMETSP1177-20130426/25734_1 /TAXON_ID=2985 /ORGANISM="Ochromonas sp, Strain CCMP1899" /LENGTH=42 /DNA_ID= /DNA_START= /DNA_END= /DNA_ORIENTATION=